MTPKAGVELGGFIEVRPIGRLPDVTPADDVLITAIEVITKAAAEHQVGILVTRIDTGRYIVPAHPAVPFWLIRQRGAVST